MENNLGEAAETVRARVHSLGRLWICVPGLRRVVPGQRFPVVLDHRQPALVFLHPHPMRAPGPFDSFNPPLCYSIPVPPAIPDWSNEDGIGGLEMVIIQAGLAHTC